MWGAPDIAYRRRLRRALWISVAIHVVVLLLQGLYGEKPPKAAALRERPITLNLQPEERSAKRLVDAPTPSDEPAQNTDLIAEANTKAADRSNTNENERTPHMDRIGESERLPVPAVPPTMPSPPVAPHQAQEQPDSEEPAHEEPAPETPPEEPLVVVAEEPSPEPEDEPIELAKLEPEPEVMTPPSLPRETVEEVAPTPAEGREEGGVGAKGVLSYEAKKHELAAYMKEVRNRVEGRWRAMLQLEYKGTASTKAVIDCCIRPDGTLAYARIVETGESISYAPLCKKIIEDSAPFPPFPFDVPDVYRTKNLEIRWTFSFM